MFIGFGLSPVLSANSNLEQSIDLYQKKKYSNIIAADTFKDIRFENGKLLVYYKALIKQKDQPKAKEALKQIEKNFIGPLEAVALKEKVQVFRSERKTSELIRLLGNLPVRFNTDYFTGLIISAIKDSSKHKRPDQSSRGNLEKAFQKFEFAAKSPTLLKLYLSIIPEQDSQKNWAILQLYQHADIGSLSLKIKQKFKFIRDNPHVQATAVQNHFVTQYKKRNFTYIREVVPEYLKKMKYADRKIFERIRSIFYKTYFKSRRYSRGLTALENRKLQNTFQFLEQERWLLQFKFYLRQKKESPALGVIDKLDLGNYENEVNYARYAIGEYYFDKGQWLNAFEQLRKVNGKEFSNKRLARLQWLLFLVNHRVHHIVNLQRIADWAAQFEFEEKESAARFCYWGYKLGLYRSGSYLNCYQKFPHTYYGLQAKVVSQPSGAFDSSGPDIQFRFKRRALTAGEAGYLTILNTLYEIGETRLADAMVELVKTSDPDLTYFDSLKDLLVKQNRYYLFYTLVMAHYDKLLQNNYYGSHYILPLKYPLAFQSLVQKNAERAKVDPTLVYAVMREESRFRDYVKSGAGAIGLLQLMPKTARYIGRLNKVRVKTRNLVDPALNLKLGSLYLKRLSRRYKGNLYYTLAAYNGGGTHVKRWIKNVSTDDMDYFVELITFSETRNYVKRVLKSYYLYQNIYGPL